MSAEIRDLPRAAGSGGFPTLSHQSLQIYELFEAQSRINKLERMPVLEPPEPPAAEYSVRFNFPVRRHPIPVVDLSKPCCATTLASANESAMAQLTLSPTNGVVTCAASSMSVRRSKLAAPLSNGSCCRSCRHCRSRSCSAVCLSRRKLHSGGSGTTRRRCWWQLRMLHRSA